MNQAKTGRKTKARGAGAARSGSRGRGGKKFLGIFLGTIVGLFVLGGVALAVDYYGTRGDVPRGTTVGGVNIGGMAPDEAQNTLEQELGSSLSEDRTATAGEKKASFSPVAAGLSPDWEATVAQAGDQPINPLRRLAALFGTTTEADVVSDIDEGKLAAESERVAGELGMEPKDGAVSLEGGKVKVTDPVIGQKVEAKDLADAIRAAWLDPAGVDVAKEDLEPEINDDDVKAAADGPAKAAVSSDLTVNGRNDVTAKIPTDRMGEVVHFVPRDGALAADVDTKAAGGILGDQLAESETEPKNAQVLSGGGVNPHVDGVLVDWDKTMSGFSDRATAKGDERTWDAAYRDEPASFTTDEAKGATFDEVVGEFTTNGFSGPSGTNIGLTAKTVNGAIVNPGETFSLNGFTGPRGTAQGYVESGVILNGHSDKAVGGGISQFATTLYNAAYFAGMEDVTHTPHSYYISRYPAGREATVYEGAIDLAFKNTSDHPVRIDTEMGANSITVKLMGVKTVRVESSNGGRWATTQPQPITVSGDSCAPSSGAPGFTTSDTRTIYDQSGSVLSEETQTTVYDPQPIVRCS